MGAIKPPPGTWRGTWWGSPVDDSQYGPYNRSTHTREWGNPSRAYGQKHRLMTAGMVHVTAGMVRVTNPVTPGSECNPTPRYTIEFDILLALPLVLVFFFFRLDDYAAIRRGMVVATWTILPGVTRLVTWTLMPVTNRCC